MDWIKEIIEQAKTESKSMKAKKKAWRKEQTRFHQGKLGMLWSLGHIDGEQWNKAYDEIAEILK